MNLSASTTWAQSFSYLRRLCFVGLAVCIVVVMPVRADVTYSPVVGWNLLGNSSGQSIDVVNNFGDKSKVTTVWKWNRLA